MKTVHIKIEEKNKGNRWNISRIGAIGLLLIIGAIVSGCVSPDENSVKSAAGTQPQVKTTYVSVGPQPGVTYVPPPLKIPGSATSTPTPTPTPNTPKTTSAPSTQTTTAPVSSVPSGPEELLIKQSDVPEFPLTDYSFMATSASGPQTYKEKLPAGMQNIGQTSVWGDIKKHGVSSQITTMDFTGSFADIAVRASNCDKQGTGTCGSVGIGDTSFFMDAGSDATGVWQTGVQFTKGTYCVAITVVTDNRQASHDKAFYVANKVLGRLK